MASIDYLDSDRDTEVRETVNDRIGKYMAPLTPSKGFVNLLANGERETVNDRVAQYMSPRTPTKGFTNFLTNR